MSDAGPRYRTIGMLDGICQPDSIQLVVVEGDPISKARPRFCSNGRPYTPSKTVLGEKRIALMMKHVKKHKANVAVACTFYRSSRQRIDIDNMIKAVLDAGTRAKIWDDDSQVTALIGVLEYDPERPRTIICFGEHRSSLTRGLAAMVDCQACGKSFFPSGKRRERARWCSRECATYLAEPIECPVCKTKFKRRSGNQTYCGRKCLHAGRAALSRQKAAARTHCLRGHELSPENTHVLPGGYRRCRRCQADAAMQRSRNPKKPDTPLLKGRAR